MGASGDACGRIDWEAHANDAGGVLKAMEEMDRVLKTCYRYYREHEKNTLMIFTADHETGGFGFTYTYNDSAKAIALPSGALWAKRVNGVSFDMLLALDRQQRSLSRIVEMSRTSDELVKNVQSYTGFPITRQEAKLVMDAVRREQ